MYIKTNSVKYYQDHLTQDCHSSILSGQAEDAATAQETDMDNMEPESKRRKTDDSKFFIHMYSL